MQGVAGIFRPEMHGATCQHSSLFYLPPPGLEELPWFINSPRGRVGASRRMEEAKRMKNSSLEVSLSLPMGAQWHHLTSALQVALTFDHVDRFSP